MRYDVNMPEDHYRTVFRVLAAVYRAGRADKVAAHLAEQSPGGAFVMNQVQSLALGLHIEQAHRVWRPPLVPGS